MVLKSGRVRGWEAKKWNTSSICHAQQVGLDPECFQNSSVSGQPETLPSITEYLLPNPNFLYLWS